MNRLVPAVAAVALVPASFISYKLIYKDQPAFIPLTVRRSHANNLTPQQMNVLKEACRESLLDKLSSSREAGTHIGIPLTVGPVYEEVETPLHANNTVIIRGILFRRHPSWSAKWTTIGFHPTDVRDAVYAPMPVSFPTDKDIRDKTETVESQEAEIEYQTHLARLHNKFDAISLIGKADVSGPKNMHAQIQFRATAEQDKLASAQVCRAQIKIGTRWIDITDF